MDQKAIIQWTANHGYYEAKIGDAWVGGFWCTKFDEQIVMYGNDALLSGEMYYREKRFDTVESAKEYVEDCTLGWLEQAQLISAGVLS